MSIKSIQVKLYIKNDEEGKKSLKAIALTHYIHNLGVKYFMEKLLLLRQEDVWEDENSSKPTKKAQDFKKELLEIAREAQNNNISQTKGTDEEILKLLRKTYEQIIPSSIGGKTNAQSVARDWLNSLVSRGSQAGLGESKSGRKPNWEKYPEGDPRRETGKQKYDERQKEKKEKEIRPKLQEMGLLPLFPMFRLKSGFDWKGRDDNGKIKAYEDDNVTGFERDMFQQAIEHLSSWESWNKNAKERHKKFNKELKSWEEENEDKKDKFEILLNYEKERKEKSEQDGALSSNEPFRINRRMIKGWDRIKEKWLSEIKKKSGTSSQRLIEIVKEYQTKNPKDFGDYNLFEFLATDKARDLWSGEYDFILYHIKHNKLLKNLESSKPYTIMTLPEALKHPLWIRLDVPDGTNINDYKLKSNSDRWEVELSLLCQSDSNNIIERKFSFQIAPSVQMKYISLKNGSLRDIVLIDQGTKKEFEGRFGQASIHFEREILEKMNNEKLMTKGIYPVYLNISVDLQDNESIDAKIFKKKPRDASGFQPIIGLEDIIGLNNYINNLGCLSVDLGVRLAGACSVFRLTDNDSNNNKKLRFKIDGSNNLYVEHERSFLLTLPGDNPDAKIETKREELWKKLKKFNLALKHMNKLISIKGLDEESCKKELGKLEQADKTDILDYSLIGKIKNALDGDREKRIMEIHREWEKEFSKKLQEWRKESSRLKSSKSRYYGIWDLSLNGIEYLERVRRLLIRWTNHPRESKEIKKLTKDKVFAQKLQKHIDNLKEDRIKKIADLIIMSALGYTGNERKEKKYESCHIILFEDLDRYKFKTDRPRYENSMLMKWAHRSILKEVYNQAKVYGIIVGVVGAGFTSRYYSGKFIPGIRCKPLCKEDMKKEDIKEIIKEIGLDENSLKENDLIPYDGGELFCTVDENNKLISIHADINAAQNLQRRFWTNYSEQFRVKCEKSNNVCIPIIGKRNENFWNAKVLVPDQSNGETFYKESFNSQKKSKKIKDNEYKENEIDFEDDEMSEEEETEIKKQEILFRDPSGIILQNDRWYDYKTFWSIVKSKIYSKLKENIKNK